MKPRSYDQMVLTSAPFFALDPKPTCNIPKPPTLDQWRDIARMTIDTVTGKVYSSTGRELGKQVPQGYVVVYFYSGSYKLGNRRHRDIKRHHLVWWAATGEWPPQEIDHKDRIKYHDRFDNLELSNRIANTINKPKASGLPPGVFAHSQTNKFMASYSYQRKSVYLGLYDTPEEAHQAYINARASNVVL